jgi:hypothetical protein
MEGASVSKALSLKLVIMFRTWVRVRMLGIKTNHCVFSNQQTKAHHCVKVTTRISNPSFSRSNKRTVERIIPAPLDLLLHSVAARPAFLRLTLKELHVWRQVRIYVALFVPLDRCRHFPILKQFLVFLLLGFTMARALVTVRRVSQL